MHDNLLTGSSSDSVFFHRNFPVHFTVHSLTVHSLKPQWTMITSISSLQCAKSSWETGLTVVWAKPKKKHCKTWANKSRNNKKHFIFGTVCMTQHMEAEIGPLIPFWCESTFTAEKLPSFSGFNQKVPFLPPKQQKWPVREETQTRKETCSHPAATTAGISVKCFNVE